MDDPLAGMDPEKRRRGSLAVLRALCPERFGGETAPDASPAASDDCAAPAPEADAASTPAPECNESTCRAGHDCPHCGKG